MAKPDDGGQAFPRLEFFDEKIVGIEDGMTLRDYFAAHAPPSTAEWMTRIAKRLNISFEEAAAQTAYAFADAMLAERKKVQ